MFELAQAKRELMVIIEIFVRNISVFKYCKSFKLFWINTLENRYYSILLKRLSRMLEIL